MADGLLEVRRFDCTKSQNAMAKDVAIKIFGIMTLWAHSGNGKSVVISPGLRNTKQPYSASRSVRPRIALDDFVAR
jgi:hypothetical protein